MSYPLTTARSLQMNELAQSVLSCQPLGIAVIGRDLTINLWNHWLEEWSGVSASQLTGAQLDGFFQGLAGSDFTAAIEDVLFDGRTICWTQRVDPERLDLIERAMTRGDRELPLHRVQLMPLQVDDQQLCLIQIDEAPYEPMVGSERRQPVVSEDRDGTAAYLDTDLQAVLELDNLGFVQRVNPAAEAMFGYSADQLLSAPLRLLFPDLDGLPDADLKLYLEDCVRSSSDGLLEAASADGRSLGIQVDIFHSAAHKEGYVLCCRDASVLNDANETLFRQRELISAIYEQVADGLLLADDQGLVEHINPVGLELLHLSDRAVENLLVSELLSFCTEQGDALPCPATEALSRGTAVNLPEGAQLQHSGREPVTMMATATPLRNRENRLVGVVVVFRAVSEARRVSSRLAWQSLHDPLTQLPNRRQLERELATTIEQTQSKQDFHTLLYIDLYNFSVINDTCGHHAGDELLRQFARLLSRHTNSNDLVARLGSDEFAVLLKNRSVDECREIADDLLWQIKSFSFPWGERRLKIAASIGAKVIDRDTHSEIDALVAAAAACATAKEAGRNRMHFQYRSQEVAQRQSMTGWIPRITEALEEDRFVLYCQPIVSTANPEPATRHYEVLVRMVDRDGKLVSPGSFIPAAEQYGLIDDLDRWTFERMIEYLQTHPQGNKNYKERFSVNLSGYTIGDESFREYVLERFRETGIDPRQFQFEITETAAVRNFDRAMEFIRALKAKGCYFSLDDFGSGLSSFGYLKQLPVDFLKIDGSFIHNMEFNDIDYSMISTINHLGHIMGIRTVAECVENETQLAMLREIGIDYVQGYHLAQPKPIDQL